MKRTAYDSESELVESIADSLSKAYPYYDFDFADNGYELYVTNTDTEECFTVIVHQDE